MPAVGTWILPVHARAARSARYDFPANVGVSVPEPDQSPFVTLLQHATAWVLDPLPFLLLLAPGRRGWNWLLRSERAGGIAWRIVGIILLLLLCGVAVRIGLWIVAGVPPFLEP